MSRENVHRRWVVVALRLIVAARSLIIVLWLIIVLLWGLIEILRLLRHRSLEAALVELRCLSLWLLVDWSGCRLIVVVLGWLVWFGSWLLRVDAECRSRLVSSRSRVVFWIEINVGIFAILTVVDFAIFNCRVSAVGISVNCRWRNVDVGTLWKNKRIKLFFLRNKLIKRRLR